MTTLLELAALVVTIVAIFGTLAIIHLWLGAMAQWLWLLTIRGPLVAAVSFAVLVATLVALQLLTGLDMMTSLGFLIGLVAMPFAAIPLANLIAYRLAPTARRVDPSSRNFIFADKRRRQSADYSAPSIDP